MGHFCRQQLAQMEGPNWQRQDEPNMSHRASHPWPLFLVEIVTHMMGSLTPCIVRYQLPRLRNQMERIRSLSHTRKRNKNDDLMGWVEETTQEIDPSTQAPIPKITSASPSPSIIHPFLLKGLHSVTYRMAAQPVCTNTKEPPKILAGPCNVGMLLKIFHYPSPMLHLFPSKKATYPSPDQRYGLDMESSKKEARKSKIDH